MEFSIIPITFLVVIVSSGLADACNKISSSHRWGAPVIILKPTLIPRLKHAYYQGKALIDVHRIIAPSLKTPFYHYGVLFGHGGGRFRGGFPFGKEIGWAPPKSSGPSVNNGGSPRGQHAPLSPNLPVKHYHHHRDHWNEGSSGVINKETPGYFPAEALAAPHRYRRKKWSSRPTRRSSKMKGSPSTPANRDKFKHKS